MKTNVKALELIEKGLSSKTVSKLTESQIEVLHSKIVSEQNVTQTQQTVTKTKIPTSVAQKGTPVTIDGKRVEVKSDPTGVELTKMTEEDDEDSKNNPWAICHKQLGPKKNAKFESCVKQVKKSLKEGKNPISLFIENKIMQLVETHLPPKITKQDLVKYLSEAEPAVAPAGPKTKPGTKEPPSPVKTPSHPGKNPNPGVKEAPKAKKKNEEVSENSPATAPAGPKTKPGTKQPPSPVKTPSHPGKNPNPGVKEAPKAKNIDVEDAKEKIIDTIMKMLQK